MATYMRRRSSSVSSSLRSARDDGKNPSTAQMRNTASHSLPFALWAVLSTSASRSRSPAPARSCVEEGGSSASAERNTARDGIARGDHLELIEIGEARLGAVVPLAENVVVQPPHARDLGRERFCPRAPRHPAARRAAARARRARLARALEA